MSEDLLLDTSQLLIDYGLRDLGYNYVVLDDCWSTGRGDDGYLIVDKEKFPNGMLAVSEKLHDKDLLFGMYSSAGEMTCARYAGSLDYEVQDATSFASWGVDYLKYDNCYHMGRFGTPLVSFNRFNDMAKALKATGRAILYSLCSWGEDYVHTVSDHRLSIPHTELIVIVGFFNRQFVACLRRHLRLVRTSRCALRVRRSYRPALRCSRHSLQRTCHHQQSCSIRGPRVPWRVERPRHARGGPGRHDRRRGTLPLACNLDLTGVLTGIQYKAHFSLWAALKSPLLLGNDIRKLDARTLSIINNAAIIAINQDPRGKAIQRVSIDTTVSKDEYGVGESQVWSGPLANGDQVVILLNAADEDLDMSVSLAEIFVMDGPGGSAPQVQQKWAVHDLWANRMSEADAETVLKSGKVVGAYNATEVPYSRGLAEEDPRLFGEKIGEVKPCGQVQARVPRHAAKVFRLRSADGKDKARKSLVREEL